MSYRFAKAIGTKVFKSDEDRMAEEQFEIFGRGYARQRAEIDYWRGVAKVAIITGTMIGAIVTSIVEVKVGVSLWLFLQGLR